ncbi:protein-glutamate methylesterase/protein-glutamine glutaminase [Salinimonas sediminis]|uniref:Protein-glutamate methylesterase/protein-glutamine glutaminase n=1 Tax=Salinimonas sediminis TaxID=2303538 RepID=A0A346NJQ5_9ALTE|nr:chemotaxis response regulator protein-glutamate methylesterase [Salinimonas sediminis]AXR05762.1 chemotaxis response regulator protein-glutamate methylesterase [Salinimonas sediminis]
MAFKVLIVDDSAFYRRRVREILSEDRELNVVGEARNGQEALEMLLTCAPDVVTMDVEMPVMDGISAVKAIMNKRPVPILMFSSLTHQGAQATLDALEAGALDFLPKRFEDIAQDRKQVSGILQTKVRLLARRGVGIRRAAAPRHERAEVAMPANAPRQSFVRSSSMLTGRSKVAAQPTVSSVSRSGKRYSCLAIGASTGGPVALQKVLTPLPANFPYPIVLVQHMPGTFTHAFAQRLNHHCKINVKEAADGDEMKAGWAYLAPGGKQMQVERRGTRNYLRIVEDNSDKATYKPSVDITFTSLAKLFGGDVLGVILTGMGADGKEGCKLLRDKGANIWAQDQASCVVYGMPQAVAKENISQKNISIDNIAGCIITEMAL